MDFGLGAPVAVAREGVKRGAVEVVSASAGSQGELARRVARLERNQKTMGKQLCQVSQYSRLMRGCLIEAYEVKEDAPEPVVMKAATGKHHKEFKRLKDEGMEPSAIERKLGLSHGHGWNALVGHAKTSVEEIEKALQEQHKDRADHPELLEAKARLEIINNYVAKFQQLGIHEMCQEVRCARVCKHGRMHWVKLELHVHANSTSYEFLRKIIHPLIFKNAGATHRISQPPPGEQERLVQQVVDEEEA